jgi:hypothetical protein
MVVVEMGSAREGGDLARLKRSISAAMAVMRL